MVATKYTNAMPGTDPNAGGNHRKNMMRVGRGQPQAGSGPDFVDLYWLHIWDKITPIEQGDAGRSTTS